MLSFLQKFGIFCFLDSHQYEFHKSYECIAGAGARHMVVPGEKEGMNAVDRLREQYKDWMFGHVGYDLKNKIESLHSSNPDEILFPDLMFFIPEIVCILSSNELRIGVFDPCSSREIYEDILSQKPSENSGYAPPVLKGRFAKKEYMETIKKLQEHILRGDSYEINLCQEFYAYETTIDPLQVYRRLSHLSPNPFSAFYKFEDRYLMCASPERFLKKTGRTIISQPIKGTAKRIPRDAAADEQSRKDLMINEKERSENIMIVDLVRNDLAKICTEGSVSVQEFLSIYTFPQVHQMISTVIGNLKEGVSIADIFYATFPMGSMTGAPKKRVMELIEKYEKTKRGLFSGTIGYIDPEGDFDFNVVIRSVLYNHSRHYISVQAGSAVTFKSDPEKEYEECLLKITALKEALAK